MPRTEEEDEFYWEQREIAGEIKQLHGVLDTWWSEVILSDRKDWVDETSTKITFKLIPDAKHNRELRQSVVNEKIPEIIENHDLRFEYTKRPLKVHANFKIKLYKD